MENSFQNAIRTIVRQELTNLIGVNTERSKPEAPVRRRRKARLTNSRRAFGVGKGKVSNPKTDKRLKVNRDDEE